MAKQFKRARVVVGLHNTLAVLDDPDQINDFELMESVGPKVPGVYAVEVEMLPGGSARWDWSLQMTLQEALTEAINVRLRESIRLAADTVVSSEKC